MVPQIRKHLLIDAIITPTFFHQPNDNILWGVGRMMDSTVVTYIVGEKKLATVISFGITPIAMFP